MKKKLHRYLAILLCFIVAVGIYACGEKNTFQIAQIEKEYTNVKIASIGDMGEVILDEKRTEEFLQLFTGLRFEQTQSVGGLNEKTYSIVLLNGDEPVDTIQISEDGSMIIYSGYFFRLKDGNFDSEKLQLLVDAQKSEQVTDEPETEEVVTEESVQETTEEQEESESETLIEENEEPGQSDELIFGKEDFKENKVIAVPAWPECKVDLNGDGRMETIVYEVQSADDIHMELLFLICDSEGNYCMGKENGIQISELTAPFTEGYFLMDLDSTDDYLEVAILDEGPSADPEFHIIRCDGENQIYMGSVLTDTPYDELKIKGDGKVIGSGRLSVLQTWGAPFTWVVEGDSISLLEEEWYYPYVNSNTEKNVKQIRPITVYEEADLESLSMEVLPSEEVVTFGTTDNKNWVQFFRSDEISGWIYLEDGFYMESGGEPVSVMDIFENLNMAG